MPLEEMKTSLESFGFGPVFYGGVPPAVSKKLEQWNYIVFNRDSAPVKNQTSISDKYNIIVVAENYIPEGLVEDLIDGLNALPRMRVPDQEIQYDYAKKSDGAAIVELAKFTVVNARKREKT